jgi:hypothetical protein
MLTSIGTAIHTSSKALLTKQEQILQSVTIKHVELQSISHLTKLVSKLSNCFASSVSLNPVRF